MNLGMDIDAELSEIQRLLTSAALIMEVRKQVAKVAKEGFIVTDGAHEKYNEPYQVVVRCSGSGKVARRIRSKIQGVEVDKIADGVIGVRHARRSRG
jgi:hypothetical protein